MFLNITDYQWVRNKKKEKRFYYISYIDIFHNLAQKS